MAHDLTFDLIAAASLVVLALCLTGWLTRDVGRPERTIGWARAHGLAVTPGNAALVVWWVRLSGVLRVVGGVSGLVLGSLVDDAFAVHTSEGAGFWTWIVLGWVAGGAWAWEVVSRQGADPTPAASLVPRQVADYVPTVLRLGPWAAAAITATIAASGRWLGPAEVEGQPLPAGPELWALGGAAAGLALAAHVVLARVIARRQRSVDPEIVAADDAIRATTTHLVAGGTTAAILLLGVTAAQLAWLPHRVPFGGRGWVPLVLLIGALMSSQYLVNRPWQVRRSAGTRSTAAS